MQLRSTALIWQEPKSGCFVIAPNATPDGAGSASCTSLAMFGPLFLTSAEYVIVALPSLPSWTCGVASLITWTSISGVELGGGGGGGGVGVSVTLASSSAVVGVPSSSAPLTTTTSKYLPAGPLTVAVNVHTFEPPLAITNGTAQSRPFIVIEAPGVPVPLTEPSVSTKSWRSVIVTSSTSDWLTIVTRYENEPPGVWREPGPVTTLSTAIVGATFVIVTTASFEGSSG